MAEQEAVDKKRREAEKIFNEHKSNQANVIDFGTDPPHQLDFLTLLKRNKSMQLDVKKLHNTETEESKHQHKGSSPAKKKKGEEEVPAVSVYSQIKAAAHNRYG